jgi:hypothetical protein
VSGIEIGCYFENTSFIALVLLFRCLIYNRSGVQGQSKLCGNDHNLKMHPRNQF